MTLLQSNTIYQYSLYEKYRFEGISSYYDYSIFVLALEIFLIC